MPGPPADSKFEPLTTVAKAGEDPWWTRGEFAWGTALALGFCATWLGLHVPVPGLAAGLAVAALAPLHIGLLRRDKRVLMVLTGCVWALGCFAAVVGVVHEGPDSHELLRRLPGAHALSVTDFGFLGAPLEPGSSWATLSRDLALFALVAVLARPLAALPALLTLALFIGAVGGALGAAGFPPETSGVLVLSLVPPHLALWVLGAVGVAVGLTEEEAWPALVSLGTLRRRIVVLGLGGAALGFLARGPLVELWRGALAGSL